MKEFIELTEVDITETKAEVLEVLNSINEVGFDSDLIANYESAHNNADTLFAVIKTTSGIVVWFDNESNYCELIEDPDKNLMSELMNQLDLYDYDGAKYEDKAEFFAAIDLDDKALATLTIATEDDEDSLFKIWRVPCYGDSTSTNDHTGYIADVYGETLIFDSFADAKNHTALLDKNYSYSYGELEMPTYYICEG